MRKTLNVVELVDGEPFVIESEREKAAEEKFQRSEKLESDIIARVEAAENKITKDCGHGDFYYGQMEGGHWHGYGTHYEHLLVSMVLGNSIKIVEYHRFLLVSF